jgi:hypothetical protein
MTVHDKQLIAQATRQPLRVFWRKQMIHRRIALEIQWRQLFPMHDFSTLRLRTPIAAPPGWDEHWSAAAREYHDERRRKCAM